MFYHIQKRRVVYVRHLKVFFDKQIDNSETDAHGLNTNTVEFDSLDYSRVKMFAEKFGFFVVDCIAKDSIKSKSIRRCLMYLLTSP
jgi:tRNA splicing ligase